MFFRALSEFIWVETCSQKTAPAIVEKFEEILQKSGVPKILYCDRDSAFIADSFQKMLKKYRIECHFAIGDHKAFLSELSGKLLQEKISAYCTENRTKRWIDKLPDFVDSLNHRKLHSLGNLSPADITVDNSSAVFKLKYGDLHKKFIEFHKKSPPLRAGSLVRLKLKRSLMGKSYLSQFSSEVYQVVNVSATSNGVNMYKLRDLSGNLMYGRFPIQKLSPVYT